MKLLAALAAIAAVASAIQITEPKEGAKLDFSATNSIKWDTVSTDPQEFQIVLIDHSTAPETSKTIAAKVNTADKEYKFENFVAPPGTKYSVKFLALDTKNTGQLAESQTFAVTKSGVEPTTTSAPAPGATNANTGGAAGTSTSKAGAMATAVGLAAPVAALFAYLA